MICLVPIDTSAATGSNPVAPESGFNLTQYLGLDVTSATFDLSQFGFSAPPTNIIPSLVKTDGSKSNISVFPRTWTATSFTCDLSAPTDDSTYLCAITIIV